MGCCLFLKQKAKIFTNGGYNATPKLKPTLGAIVFL